MDNHSVTVVGIFENERHAHEVVQELVDHGFARSQIQLSGGADAGRTEMTQAIGSDRTNWTEGTHTHEGGFKGWLENLFHTDEDDRVTHKRYSGALEYGRCVVGVEVENEAQQERAAEIMNAHGALDIDTDSIREGYGGRADAGTIPVVEEELRIGKRMVQRGGVRVYTRVVERPVEEDVRLREERVKVERQRVNRPLTESDRAAMRDQTIEVVEMAEEPVVEKQARVVEEVRVGKEVTERTEKVRGTVKKTEVETEDLRRK